MSTWSDFRIDEIDLPDDIVSIARSHRDLPPRARARVLEALAVYTAEIDELDRQIKETELPKGWYIRKQLQSDRFDVERRADACRSLVGVVRSVPVEVLGAIFEWYLLLRGKVIREETPDGDDGEESEEEDQEEEEEEELNDGMGKWRRNTLTKLLYVCRYWKTVAYSTPSLWSNVVLRAMEHGPGDLVPQVHSSHVRGILTCLDRLHSYPWALTVSAVRPSSRWEPLDPSAVPLAQLLSRPASLRLTKLTVDATFNGVGMGRMVFPMVKDVVIRTVEDWRGLHYRVAQTPNANQHDETSKQWTVDKGIPSMPNLERAVLDGVFKEYEIPDVIPWGNLTHLFVDVSGRQWRAIMRLCGRLQKGVFRIRWADLEDGINYTETAHDVTLPDLEELIFLDEPPFYEPDELPVKNIVCPALKKMVLFTQWRDSRLWDYNAGQLWGNLTHLSFRSWGWVDGRDAIRIMEGLPGLEEGFFRVCEHYEEVLDFLTYGRSRTSTPGGAGGQNVGSGGLFRMRHLKALGLSLDTEFYRPLEPGEVRDEDMPPLRPFPYSMFSDFLASRTQSVARGDFDTALSLRQLGNFVVHVDRSRDSDIEQDIMNALTDVLRPYARSYGLEARVMVAPGSIYSRRGEAYGYPTVPAGEMWKHWDDGFMEFIEREEEFGLYPTHIPAIH